jgi:hypothetical protein
MMHRERRPRRRIGAAAAQDHLRAGFERRHIGLRSHHADDSLGTVDDRLRQRCCGTQRMHPLVFEPGFQPALVLFGMNQRELEMKIVLARNFMQDLHASLQMRLPARTAASADHHRDVIRDGPAQ